MANKPVTVSFTPPTAPDKGFTVISSDPLVLSVDGKIATALKAGSATLTIRSTNGKTDTVAVTVE